MLILTRRVGEGINIGDDILLTVLGTKGNQARIGIHAPRGVHVHRSEIYERIKKENDVDKIQDLSADIIKTNKQGE